jgi:hypothetical protein
MLLQGLFMLPIHQNKNQKNLSAFVGRQVGLLYLFCEFLMAVKER